MTKTPDQRPVSGFIRRPSLMLLFSSMEIGLLKGTKTAGKSAILLKKQGTCSTTFRIILSSPPIRPMVESTQVTRTNPIEYALATRMEECA